MKCNKCGAEVADGSRFCPECGNKLEVVAQEQAAAVAEEVTATAEEAEQTTETVAEEAVAAAEQVAEEAVAAAEQVAEEVTAQEQAVAAPAAAQNTVNNSQPASSANQGKKSHKGLIIGLVCGGVALLAAIIGVVCFFLLTGGTTEIDLSKYVKVTYEGADGYGEAYVTFDESKLYKDLCAESKKFNKVYSGGSASAKVRDNYYDMKDIDYKLDKEEGLSNGDKVKVSLVYDNEAAEVLGIKYTASKTEYKVEGLKEVKEVDPFEGLTVEFEGISPNVYVDIDEPDTEDYYDSISFKPKDDDYYYAKGETVTIELNMWTDEAYIANEYGVKFSTTSKDYVVENVDAYVESADEISAEMLDSMKTATEGAVQEYFDYYDSYITGSDLKYEGLYFLKSNDDDAYYPNKEYVVYSATVGSKEKEFKKQTVYFAIEYYNILAKADGTQEIGTTLEYIDSYDIEGETDIEFYDGWYKVRGFKTLDDLKEELIDKDTEYTCESTDPI